MEESKTTKLRMAPTRSAKIRDEECRETDPGRRERKLGRQSAWTRREKKTLLTVLNEFGHEDILKIASYLPSRTEEEIAFILRRHQRSALRKFKSKRRLNEQESFHDIHPWLSFVNMHCNSEAQIHDYLVAYVLPIFERYATLPKAKFGAIDFKAAYRALFSALSMQKFPDDINEETFSMIYASMKLLLKETATDTKDEFYKVELAKCLSRHFERTKTKHANGVNEVKDTLQLPEVNVLQCTPEELSKLCDVKE